MALEYITKQSLKTLLQDRFLSDERTALVDLPKPYTFKDMQKATARVAQAIKQEELIVLVSDYDVDGVTSRVLFEEFMDQVRTDYSLHFDCITPNRFKDGYGLSPHLLENYTKKTGQTPQVVITVDNGISSFKGAAYCLEHGIDLIITDHHMPSDELPKAYAIIDPKQHDCPFVFKDICGAQVAWYFIASLKDALDVDWNMGQMLDVLALAIVADVMPLVDMNRALLKRGLLQIQHSQKPAFLSLKSRLGNALLAEDIAFNIAPKINAAGRMEDAQVAIDFLRSDDVLIANETWEYLEELNAHRKSLQEDIFLKTLEQVQGNDDPVVVVADESFHEGIVGIVASKVAEHCKKVTLIGHIDPQRNLVKFSARSFGEVDIYKLIASCDAYLLGFGGHVQAAGLSVGLENLEVFKNMINEVFKKSFCYRPVQSAIGKLRLEDVDEELLEMMDAFEPFGHANPRPIFCFENLVVDGVQVIGQHKNTLRFTLLGERGYVQALKFFAQPDLIDQIQSNPPQSLSCLGQVNRNHFRGNVTIQLLISEIVVLC